MEIFDRQLPSTDMYRSEDPYRRGPDFDTTNLREVLGKLWVRKRLVFLCMIVGGILAYAVMRIMGPAYTGEAEIAIKPDQSSVLLGGDRSVPVATQVAPETVQTQAFALQSRSLASATIMRLHLDRDPEFNASLRKPGLLAPLLDPVIKEVEGWIEPKPEGAVDLPEVSVKNGKSPELDKPSPAIVNAFMRQLHVTAQQRSNVIQVSFRSWRPATAAAVPNELIKIYLEQRAAEKDQALVLERQQLDNVILPAFRKKMAAAEKALAEHQKKSGLISGRNATVLGQELSETRAQLETARAHTEGAELRLREAESTGASPRTAADPLTIQRLREQQVALQGQLAALKGSHGPNYPQTKQLEAQVQQVKEGVRRESSDAVGRLKTGLAVAQEAEMALNKRATELTRQFALVSGGDTQLQNLIAENDADRKAYEGYLAHSSQLLSSIGHAQADAALLSAADIPLRPSPSPPLFILVGIFGGAGAGLVWVTLLDGLLKGMRNERQIEEILGIKCLGLVPKVQGTRRFGIPSLERSNAIRDSRPNAIRDFTLNPKYAAFGEAIRSAQMKLLRFDRQTESRVILITAALPNEGKSWVAASLAMSLAADGCSCVLVDCDLNRPTVHRMFGGPRGPGLTDYFAGGVSVDAVVHGDSASGMSYVPIGNAMPRETWRKSFGLLRPLVDQLREKYEFVILDSAPVLAIADTILLSQIAQKTILVVKWASTPPAVARRAAVQLLESAGAEVAALLSMVNTKRAAKNGDSIAGVYRELGKTYYGRR